MAQNELTAGDPGHARIPPATAAEHLPCDHRTALSSTPWPSFLATPEGLRTARLLQAAGLLGEASSPEPQPLPRPPLPISIWQPREADGETVWVRPDPGLLGDHFAATKVFRRKKAELPRAVVLFGESVAAGYLYAPHVTPAGVLEGSSGRWPASPTSR